MRILIILTLLSINWMINAQADSIKIYSDQLIAKQIKLFLFSQMYFDQLSEVELQSYFNQELKIQLLDSKGFRDIEFYHIPHQHVIEYKGPENIIYTKYMPLEPGVPEKMIVGRNINTGRLYIISGVKGNGIKHVVSRLDSYMDPSNDCYKFRTNKKRIPCLWIDGVNFKDIIEN